MTGRRLGLSAEIIMKYITPTLVAVSISDHLIMLYRVQRGNIEETLDHFCTSIQRTATTIHGKR